MFQTELFERYQRSEKALVSALMQVYVEGGSTRKVKAVTEELCGMSFSKSTYRTLKPRPILLNIMKEVSGGPRLLEFPLGS